MTVQVEPAYDPQQQQLWPPCHCVPAKLNFSDDRDHSAAIYRKSATITFHLLTLLFPDPVGQ